MSKQKGLPTTRKMRHDFHFVENLAMRKSDAIGRLIPLEKLDLNPSQPRAHVGDLSDLVSSIKEKGVLEPLLVSPRAGRYQIIAGERRFRASLEAGLSQVPCVEVDADEKGILEISLIENLQRKDLTAFEEAEGIRRLCERFGYTHEQAARKLGRARTSITESFSILQLPPHIRERCEEVGLTAKSMLLQIAREKTPQAMEKLMDRILASGLSREDVRQTRRGEKGSGRPKNYVFKFRPPDKRFSFHLTFRKPEVEKAEVLAVLREMITQLENS